MRDLPTSRAARSIVRALVAVSEELRVELVAEGVETASEAAWVERLEGLRERASWGSFMGAGGVRHTAPSPFALGCAEC